MATTDDGRTTQTAPDDRAPARWSRLASVGLILAALGPVLMLAASLGWNLGVEEELPFFGGAAVVGLIAAFLVRRPGLWTKIVGIVAALLIAGALFWTAFGLSQPTSFFDFMPGLLVMPGALLAIVASIGAIVAGRRGRRTARAEGGERTAIRVAVGVAALAAVVTGVLTLTARTSADEAEADEVVRLADFEFDQATYTYDGGTSVLVRNDDPFLHTYTVDALGIDETLNPGSEAIVVIPDEPGEYIVYCRPHTFEPEEPADDDMAAELRVE